MRPFLKNRRKSSAVRQDQSATKKKRVKTLAKKRLFLRLRR